MKLPRDGQALAGKTALKDGRGVVRDLSGVMTEPPGLCLVTRDEIPDLQKLSLWLDAGGIRR
jgi:hypothetical protein